MSHPRIDDPSVRDIVLYLLQFLDPFELANLALVSKTFYQLAHHQYLWKQLVKTIFPSIYENENNNNSDWFKIFLSQFKAQLFGLDFSFIKLFFYLQRNEIINFDKHLEQLTIIDEKDHWSLSLLKDAELGEKQEVLDIIFQRVIIEYLDENGTLNIRHTDQCKRTILHWAVYCHQPVTIIQSLIDLSCDIIAIDNSGFSPINIACSLGYLPIVKGFLEKEPNLLNMPDKYNATPIMVATRFNQLPIVTFLATLRAELDHQIRKKDFSDGFTALHWAVYNNHLEIGKILLDHGAKVDLYSYGLTPVHLASKDGKLAFLQLFLEKDSTLINARDILLQTPILWAASTNQVETVNYLAKAGASLDYSTMNPGSDPKNGFTALHWAAYKNYIDVVKVLLLHHADTNRTTPISNEAPDDVTLNSKIKQMIRIERVAQELVSQNPATLFGQTTRYQDDIDAITALRKVVLEDADSSILNEHMDTLNYSYVRKAWHK